MDKIKLAQRTIALLSSMIESGECHTARSREIKNNALEGLEQLRLGAVSNSVCDCCVPSPEDPFEYKNPICRKCGGAMKQNDC